MIVDVTRPLWRFRMKTLITLHHEGHWSGLAALAAMTCVWLLALSVSCGSDPTPTVSAVATVQPTESGPAGTAVPTTSTLEVPIEVRGAFNVGGLQLELLYDPAVLDLRSVKAGPLGRNALLESNQATAGVVRIALIDANGINGDGEIITVVFVPTQQAGSSSLTLDSVEASDIHLRDLVVQASSSQYTGPADPLTPPALIFRP